MPVTRLTVWRCDRCGTEITYDRPYEPDEWAALSIWRKLPEGTSELGREHLKYALCDVCTTRAMEKPIEPRRKRR